MRSVKQKESFKFNLGATVQKRKGYRWPGVIVGRFHTLRGKARFVVECVVKEVSGALHIFSVNDLKRRRVKK